MKRNLLLIGLTLVLAFVAVMIDNAQTAEKPKGTQLSNTAVVDYGVTAGNGGGNTAVDTSLTPSGSSTPWFNFTAVKDYGSVYGWFVIEITNLDTANAADDLDTTVDSMAFDIITAEEGGTPWKIVWTGIVPNIHTTAAVVNGDYQSFDISDSGLWAKTYVRLRTWCADSTAALGDTSYGADYKVTAKFFAK